MSFAQAPPLNYNGPFFTDFEICCVLRTVLELHQIVFILWFARPHIENSFIKKELLRSAVKRVKRRPETYAEEKLEGQQQGQ